MKLIFALGNHSTEYDKTRHNVGFSVLDALAAKHNVSFQHKSKFKSSVSEITVNDEKVLLAKPSTFYNDIGESYRLLLDFYKLAPEDTLIVHDELALPFGTIRSRFGGSDAGNNGIKSLNQHGGGPSLRIRIGIANEKRIVLGDTDFVLSKFSKDEKNILEQSTYAAVLAIINTFITGGQAATTLTVLPDDETSELVV